MAFGKTYQEIEEMILQTALYTPVARAIARRAGLRPGGVIGERRMGMLLIAEGSEQEPAGSGDTPVVYSTLAANNDEFVFTPGDSSWIVPTASLYRITATLCIATPSGEGMFGHAFLAGTSGNRAVLRLRHYVPPTTSDLPERIVLAGTATLQLEQGEAASHVFFNPSGGTPGNVLQDPEASRLYVERVS